MNDAILRIKRYTDKDGSPTCAKDFRTGEVCQFLYTKRFGSILMCNLYEHELYEDSPIQPLKQCELWGDRGFFNTEIEES